MTMTENAILLNILNFGGNCKMKLRNEMTLEEKVEYDRKDLLAIEESTNANINDLTDSIKYFSKFIHKSFLHYEQRLKWHDEELNENADEHATMTTLIIGSFVMHILIIIYLIIKGV